MDTSLDAGSAASPICFTDENIRKLEVQLDPTQCSLGKWLSSNEHSVAEASIPTLEDIFAEIDEPLRRLLKALSASMKFLKPERVQQDELKSKRFTNRKRNPISEKFNNC
jgi:hypothetical protein